MVRLATLAPAATAADATGFARLKRYLAGREPALPEGCVLDVGLEAKELLGRFLPACRAAVEEAYRGMRAELEGAAFTRVPGDAALDMANFAAWWLEWPLSRWMDDQAGQRWFTRRGDRFVADFTCPPELRAAFELLTGELVDLRLAHYSQSRLRAPVALKAHSASEGNRLTTTFRAKVSHSGGKPILFLPTVESVPSRPTGPTRVRLPDGREWVFRFVKVACNVAHPADAASARGNNALPALLRDWFGPDAGLPGTNFEVEFTATAGAWSASPTSLREENGASHHFHAGPDHSDHGEENGGWHEWHKVKAITLTSPRLGASRHVAWSSAGSSWAVVFSLAGRAFPAARARRQSVGASLPGQRNAASGEHPRS